MDSVFEIINVFSERYNQIHEKCTEDFYTYYIKLTVLKL